MDYVIITVAPTGNVPTKEMNPSVPITPAEIAADVARCCKEGAAIAHLHARDSQGKPTSKAEYYSQVVAEVKKNCDSIIQVSTGARGGKSLEERSEPLSLKTEMGSLSTGSSNFASSVNENSPELINYLAEVMKKNNIKPEIEVFDSAMISNATYLVKKGVLDTPLHFNLVMNVPGSIKGTPKNLLHLIESLPADSTYSVTAIGRKAHLPLITMAMVMGAHVRVGMEDTLEYTDGSPADNLGLVRKAVTIAEILGKKVADPQKAREILSLS